MGHAIKGHRLILIEPTLHTYTSRVGGVKLMSCIYFINKQAGKLRVKTWDFFKISPWHKPLSCIAEFNGANLLRNCCTLWTRRELTCILIVIDFFLLLGLL